MDTRSELSDCADVLPVYGTDAATMTREAPGMSAFALEDGVVYHTYSAYTRGLDGLWGMYQWLDRAPRGRNETMVRGFGDLRGSRLVPPPRRVRQGLSREGRTMSRHATGTREEWLAARLELLQAEKELTRRSDELARRRQELPWVRIDKEYRFETDEGSASLADLFRGRSQLLVYHFMFGPDYTAGCPSCSAIADGFNGFVVHLANHDVMLWAVSRAPLAKLQAYKRRMGWTFPWASSLGSDFNFDFNVWFTEEQQREGGIEYNYRREAVFEWRAGQEGGGEGAEAKFAAMCGTDVATYHRDRPGMSAFALEDGVVYHTYSTYARGLDGLWGMYQWLDRAPKGRNETGVWWRRHDETDVSTRSDQRERATLTNASKGDRRAAEMEPPAPAGCRPGSRIRRWARQRHHLGVRGRCLTRRGVIWSAGSSCPAGGCCQPMVHSRSANARLETSGIDVVGARSDWKPRSPLSMLSEQFF